METQTLHSVVISLFTQGKSQSKILKALKPWNVKRLFIYRTVKRYQETNSIEDRPHSGRPRSKRTPDVIKAIQEKIRQNPRRCQTDLAVQHDMSRQSMGRLIHEDLHMWSYHLRKVHLLSELQKVKRKDKCAKILQCLTAGTLPNLIFSDEKLFTGKWPGQTLVIESRKGL